MSTEEALGHAIDLLEQEAEATEHEADAALWIEAAKTLRVLLGMTGESA